MASPVRYFKLGARVHDICRVKQLDLTQVSTAIVGGGGLFFFDSLRYLCENHPGPKIGWGLGSNQHGSDQISYPDYISSFCLLGVRDWGTPFYWVPCASCMHDCFDQHYEIEHDVVVYEHYKQKLGLNLPTLANDRSFTDVVKHLGAGKVVLTNSYHGMYWATLLGRGVIAFPFSSRFYGMKHVPVLCGKEDWMANVPKVREYPEALSECRQANVDYYQRVKELIPLRL